jgi:hypothetical protein
VSTATTRRLPQQTPHPKSVRSILVSQHPSPNLPRFVSSCLFRSVFFPPIYSTTRSAISSSRLRLRSFHPSSWASPRRWRQQTRRQTRLIGNTDHPGSMMYTMYQGMNETPGRRAFVRRTIADFLTAPRVVMGSRLRMEAITRSRLRSRTTDPSHHLAHTHPQARDLLAHQHTPHSAMAHHHTLLSAMVHHHTFLWAMAHKRTRRLISRKT